MSPDPDIFRRAKNKYFRTGIRLLTELHVPENIPKIQEGIKKIQDLRKEYEEIQE